MFCSFPLTFLLNISISSNYFTGPIAQTDMWWLASQLPVWVKPPEWVRIQRSTQWKWLCGILQCDTGGRALWRKSCIPTTSTNSCGTLIDGKGSEEKIIILLWKIPWKRIWPKYKKFEEWRFKFSLLTVLACKLYNAFIVFTKVKLKYLVTCGFSFVRECKPLFCC